MLRVVCRNGFSHDRADLFLGDLDAAVRQLSEDSSAGPASGSSGFHH